MRLSEPQKAIIRFMQQGHARSIKLYHPRLKEHSRTADIYFSKTPVALRLGLPTPRLTYRVVAVLLARGLLMEEEGEFRLSQHGKEIEV